MFEAFLQGLVNVVRPDVFIAIILSTIIGLTLGVIPAISGGMTCILLLPFIFGMDPVFVLPIMGAMIAVSATGGSITAVLVGIPGDVANTATILDGFAMTRNGQPDRALGLAISSSMIGGLFAILLSFVMIPITIPIIMLFKSPELLLVVVLALLFLSVLTERNRIKGLIIAAVGLLLSCVGFQSSTGIARFTFGNLYLYDGIDTITAMLGILAMPVLFELTALGQTISKSELPSSGKLSRMLQGGLELAHHHKWLLCRSGIIGYIVGIIPVLGSSAAVWVAYGQAKKMSKEPEQFGTGSPEGIIAPEAAATSCHAGDVLCTLALGIPGSGGMVILLAAFLLVGLQPGPEMLTKHTDISFTILIAMGLATIIGGLICFLGSPYLTRVTRLSPLILFAWLVPVVFIAAFVSRLYLLDLFLMLVLSLIGVVVNRFGFPAPALILGFIMGKLLEYYLWLSIDRYGFGFATSSPTSIILLCLIFMTIAYEPLKRLIGPVLRSRNMK
jgi:putative tricarboxylic transport membrane protein